MEMLFRYNLKSHGMKLKKVTEWCKIIIGMIIKGEYNENKKL